MTLAFFQSGQRNGQRQCTFKCRSRYMPFAGLIALHSKAPAQEGQKKKIRLTCRVSRPRSDRGFSSS